MIIAEIESRIQLLTEEMNEHLYSQVSTTATAEAVENSENTFHRYARELADQMSASHLQRIIESSEMSEAVRMFVNQLPGRYKNCGWRPVNIRFIGGTTITLKVPYYARNCDKNKCNKGLYPVLFLLGIHERCTPGLISEVSLLSAGLCSFEEAKQMLDSRGISMNIKTVRNIAKRFAARARLAQEKDVERASKDASATVGRKVVVSADGGRIRIRSNKRGRKSGKGRQRYRTDWKEPKLLIIYITDKDGKLDKTFSPYIDGTLNGPDAIFALLKYYLVRIGVTSADKLLFVSDGALWIWERVKPLLTELELAEDQVYELIDFYHAVEHLNALAKLQSGWSQADREKWVRKRIDVV